MRLRSVLERHPGAGVLWTGVTGKVEIYSTAVLLYVAVLLSVDFVLGPQDELTCKNCTFIYSMFSELL